MIDDDAPRLCFVRNQIAVHLDGDIPENVNLPVHPNHPNMGVRSISMNPPTVHIESDDASGLYRLKEFADVETNGVVGSIERSDKRPIIHWVSATSSKEATLIIPNQEQMQHISGRVEANDYPIGTIVQLERIGYAIITEDGYLLMHE